MSKIKEFLCGTPQEIQGDNRYSQLKSRHHLTPRQSIELAEAKRLSRRLFLRRTGTFIGACVVATGSGLGLLNALGHKDAAFDLLDFEAKYQDRLLASNEKKLKQEWLAKIAETFIINTAFSGKTSDLTENSYFVYSPRDFLERARLLPGYEPGGIDSGNAVTVFDDKGISGTVFSVARVLEITSGTPYNPTRILGIICAHEMGHRASLGKKKLDEPFLLPDGAGSTVMKVTHTLGLKMLGFDASNPNRPLNALSRLDETSAEFQAQKTYGSGYKTIGSPSREAPLLLSRILNLIDMLNMSKDSLIFYQRNNDPFGFLSEISKRTGAALNYADKIIHGLDITYSALDGDMERVKKIIENPK